MLLSEQNASYLFEKDQIHIINSAIWESNNRRERREKILILSQLFQQFLDFEFTIINTRANIRQVLRDKLIEFEVVVMGNEEEYARNFLQLINQVRQKYNL